MCKYLYEQSDSNAENLDLPPLSDNSNVQGRSRRSPGRMSKADINANTPSKQAITYQSEKSSATARPTDSIMSTPTNGAPVTAASTATAEVIDSITDTDTTDTAVSGAGQVDKPPTLTSDTSNSNFRVSSANSKTTAMCAQHDDVNVDVANRPHPPQADRPQRTRHVPARLLSRVHAHWAKVSFRLVISRHLAQLCCGVCSVRSAISEQVN